jgi:hypothetical protein
MGLQVSWVSRGDQPLRRSGDQREEARQWFLAQRDTDRRPPARFT